MTTTGKATSSTASRDSQAAMLSDVSEVNAISLLTSQHREVDELFAQFEGTSTGAKKSRERIVQTIIDKLTLHTQIEEKIFYPAAKEADKDLVFEAFEEHAGVKVLLRKLSNTDASDETFAAKVKVLKEMVQHHVKEEEGNLFPECAKVLGEGRLVELGTKMQKKVDSHMIQ